MRSFAVLSIASLLGITLAAVAAAAEEEGQAGSLREVGTTKQLFIDDYAIDKMVGLKKVMSQAARHPQNPILTPEHPWEGKALEAPIVLWDEEKKLFRMYYWALNSKEIYTCYATSKDGIRWDKPVLGMYEGPDGSKQNNIVLRGDGDVARMRYVALNPYSDEPDKKYVAMYIDNVPGLTEFAAYSPDGIHWTTVAKIGDLRGVTGGPPTANPPFFLVEQKWGPGKDHRYRAIWRTQSDDLKNWGGGIYVIQHQQDDDPNLEFYHATSHFLGTHTYHGLHLGYYYPYHTMPEGKKLPDGVRMAGTIDTSLMVSRDTIRWQLVDRKKPFLPTGGKDSWDAGMVFASPEIVVGDQLRFYYGAWRLEHSTGTENDGAIGLATLRLDGFVSVEPRDGQGTLTTKPFQLQGAKLEVNADTRGGSLAVEVLDQNGQPIAGLSRAECKPLADVDGLRLEVTWAGQKDLSVTKGKPVRLRFHLQDAKLYAFQVGL